MAEGTYEYECMRAELLGVDKPDYEEFMKKQAEKQAAQNEDIDVENLKEAEKQTEELQGTAGKLDELNHILQATQKKIDRFKFRCGSVTELIKTKIGNISGSGEPAEPPPTPSSADSEPESPPKSADDQQPQQQNGEAAGIPTACPRKSDLTKALDNQSGTLDSMLDKSEGLEYTMREQTKRMRKLMQ